MRAKERTLEDLFLETLKDIYFAECGCVAENGQSRPFR